ncbi:Methionine aminopeptidase [uncultured archaeon]|nr:Methionine aminopeptidase [uncultured archaeon]
MIFMDKETIANYVKAGEIAKEMQGLSRKKLKVGTNLFEFAEETEAAIAKAGGEPAFPINLSANSEAAHYTPSFESKDIVGEEDVIKVDIGVHVNGFIADSAFTIDFSGKHSAMVGASEDALEKAVSMAMGRDELGKIGAAIEAQIKSAGFRPVENLSGHGVDENDAHTYPTVPNIANKDSKRPEDDMAIAIEPFATDGKGIVHEGTQSEIFQLKEKRPVRGNEARKIIEFVDSNYKTLPFAERWLQRELKLSEFGRKAGMRELLQKGCLFAHPILKEEEGKTVTQAETTIVFSEGKAIRLL